MFDLLAKGLMILGSLLVRAALSLSISARRSIPQGRGGQRGGTLAERFRRGMSFTSVAPVTRLWIPKKMRGRSRKKAKRTAPRAGGSNGRGNSRSDSWLT